MRCLRLPLLVVACCLLCTAVGYWFGFAEGMSYGVSADFVPRGALAVGELNALRAGDQPKVISLLESDVDNGLVFGHDILQHPLRNFVGPLWGADYYSDLERFAVRMANYRKNHPSQMKEDAFDTVPPENEQYRQAYKELAIGARESIGKMNYMVEHYAAKQ